MTLEFLDSTSLERSPIRLVGGIRGDDVAALLQLERTLERANLDLAANTLGALSPLQFHCGDAEFTDHVLGHAEVRVFDIQLNHDVTIGSLVIATIGLEASLHVGSILDLTIAIQFKRGVDSTDILAADKGDTTDGRPNGKVLPVLLRDIR